MKNIKIVVFWLILFVTSFCFADGTDYLFRDPNYTRGPFNSHFLGDVTIDGPLIMKDSATLSNETIYTWRDFIWKNELKDILEEYVTNKAKTLNETSEKANNTWNALNELAGNVPEEPEEHGFTRAIYNNNGTITTNDYDISGEITNGLITKNNLVSIDIGTNVTSIGNSVFVSCTSLTNATIPVSVTNIGAYAFYGCSGLTSVTIPDSVTSIVGYAFYDCDGLKSVTIPDSVTSIGQYAFYGCSDLEKVTIGNGLTSVGTYAFAGCINLKTIYYIHSENETSDERKSFLISSGCPENATYIDITGIIQRLGDMDPDTGLIPASQLNKIIEIAETTMTNFVKKTGDTIFGSLIISNTLSQGILTSASGDYSHAEGALTSASGYGSHAEGAGELGILILSINAGAKLSFIQQLKQILNIGLAEAKSIADSIESGNPYLLSFETVEECDSAIQNLKNYTSLMHLSGKTESSGIFSHSEGINSRADGIASHTEGINSFSTNDYSFVWNGDSSITNYSHGDGTFNINPTNGLNGFYIGETNLSYLLSSNFIVQLDEYGVGIQADPNVWNFDERPEYNGDGLATTNELISLTLTDVYNNDSADAQTLLGNTVGLRMANDDGIGELWGNEVSINFEDQTFDWEDNPFTVGHQDGPRLDIYSDERPTWNDSDLAIDTDITIPKAWSNDQLGAWAFFKTKRGIEFNTNESYISSLYFNTFRVGTNNVTGSTDVVIENGPLLVKADDIWTEDQKLEIRTAVEQGLDTEANYLYAHAEGEGTKALGNFSHTEGNETMASGKYSHAEGAGKMTFNVSAYKSTESEYPFGMYYVKNDSQLGQYLKYARQDKPIAIETNASSVYSIAAIITNYVSTNFNFYFSTDPNIDTVISSLSIPRNCRLSFYATNSIGENSHTEGGSIAVGLNGHAEGLNTLSSTSYAHAEGYRTIAASSSSHAEGSSSRVLPYLTGYSSSPGSGSHAEGDNTIARDKTSHSEGYQTTAFGAYSHAEGFGTRGNLFISSVYGPIDPTYKIMETKAAHNLNVGDVVVFDGDYFVKIVNVSSPTNFTISDKIFVNRTNAVTNAIMKLTDGVAFGFASRVAGYRNIASGNYSIAEGSQARAYHDNSYVWNGNGSTTQWPEKYNSHADGSFNINPVGGITNVWIGELNLQDHINNQVYATIMNMITNGGIYIGGIEHQLVIERKWENSVFYFNNGNVVCTNLTSIPNELYYNNATITNAEIGNNVTNIGEHAFELCWGLRSVTIGNSVTNIGYDAFSGCHGLTNLIIGSSVTSIENQAFMGCSALVNLTIPDSVTEIGGSSFYSCSNLTNVIFGSSIVDIWDDAFSGCTSLQNVTFKGKTKAQVQDMNNYSNWGIQNGTKIICVDGTFIYHLDD